MPKIEIAELTPGVEFNVEGATVILSGVSGVVARSGGITSITISYDKKTMASVEDVSTDAADDVTDDGKSTRTLASKVVTKG